MRISRVWSPLSVVAALCLLSPVYGLDLLPKLPGLGGSKEQAPSGLTSAYWLMSEGGQVGYKIKVEINGQNVTTIKKPGDATEATNYLHLGLNTIRFNAADEQRSPSGASSSQLTLTLGPEHNRQSTGNFGGFSVGLRETSVVYVRPYAHRGGDSTVEMRFTLKDNPNPAKLRRRYILYSDGQFTGHMIQAAINGVPVVDVMAPNFHCDLDPYLNAGANEITFSAVRLEGYPFTASERDGFGDGGLDVGIAVAGEFDAATYNEPVQQIMKVNQRFVQPGEHDQPDPKETFTLMAE